MLIEEFLQRASTLSAITDQDTLFTFLNSAAKELWSAVDFPNTLEEASFRPYDAQNAFITLPCNIKAVRGVVPCRGMTADYHTKASGFNDDFWMRSPWKWRLVKKSPQVRNITEASLLTIRKVDTRNTESVVVAISGKTDVAENVSELVTLDSTESEKQTTNSFEDLTALAKDRLLSTNLEVYDSTGAKISIIPNNYREVQSLVIQILEVCNDIVITNCHCTRVLYKPVLPPFWSTMESLPAGMEDALLFKLREWLDLFTEDKLERAEVMAMKSTALLTREAYDNDKGQKSPFPLPRNPFIRYPHVRI